MFKRRAHSGFTLLELLLVLILFAVLAGLAMPALFGQLSKAKLDSAADQLVGLLQLARLEAMQRGTPVRVNYDVDQRTYYLDAQPTAAQLNQTGGGGATSNQEVSEDGYIRITPMWSVGQNLLDDVSIKTTLVSPPSLRMLLQELLQQETSSQGTLGGQSTIDNSFSLTTSFDVTTDLPKAQGNFIPIEFEPDGTPLNQISLRVVLHERPEDQADDSGSSGSSAMGNEQLDPEEKQRWVSIEGLTGRVYVINPPKEIVELANQHQGEQSSQGTSGTPLSGQGATP